MTDALSIPVDIYTRHDLNSGAKILFAALSAWPNETVESVALTVGLSERTAWRLLNELEQAGLVNRERRQMTVTITKTVTQRLRSVTEPVK